MTKWIFYIVFAIISINSVYAQAERKHIREGNKHYEKKEYQDAEIAYKKATDLQPEMYQIRGNMGAASFRQQKYEDASEAFTGYMLAARSVSEQAKAWYNLGTARLQEGDYVKSIDAFQKALILNPKDDDSRYNLSIAQYMLSKQRQQGGGTGSEQNQQQQNKPKEQQNGDNNENKQKQNKQSDPEKISKGDAERILKALEQDEKDLQKKVQEQKVKTQKINVEKDW
ncbi:MAG TPA: tetratricopeptide repeat protein [Bacteroidales bacterium]|nr:tetratricopeptide repeat protein [Bacteroidales bacterium]